MSRAAIVCAASLLLCAGGALAQQPKMFPGTSFPGHDLYPVPTASPEDCANRCLAEQRCKAFTWSIPERRCQLKWDSSTFDGSLTHVSGIIEGRQASPPPVAVPSAAGACSIPDTGPCAGCSVTCSTGQQARCAPATAGAGGSCAANSKCECVAQ
ncbi:MAG: PAN domain-containing protein [Burkholderiales bacterium]|jgi:hypothetical protein|nr:PAN domain-containing protein [Burkholderiales bacterium]